MENSNNFSAGESLMENAFMANEQERNIDEKERLRVEVQQDLGEKTILSVNLKDGSVVNGDGRVEFNAIKEVPDYSVTLEDGINVNYTESAEYKERKEKVREEAGKAYESLEEENLKFAEAGTKLAISSAFNKAFSGRRGKKVFGAFLGLVIMSSVLSGCGGSNNRNTTPISKQALNLKEYEQGQGQVTNYNFNARKMDEYKDVSSSPEAESDAQEIHFGIKGADGNDIEVSFTFDPANDNESKFQSYNAEVGKEKDTKICKNALGARIYSQEEIKQMDKTELTQVFVERFGEHLDEIQVASQFFLFMNDELLEKNGIELSPALKDAFRNGYGGLVEYSQLGDEQYNEVINTGRQIFESMMSGNTINVEMIKAVKHSSDWAKLDDNGNLVGRIDNTFSSGGSEDILGITSIKDVDGNELLNSDEPGGWKDNLLKQYGIRGNISDYKINISGACLQVNTNDEGSGNEGTGEETTGFETGDEDGSGLEPEWTGLETGIESAGEESDGKKPTAVDDDGHQTTDLDIHFDSPEGQGLNPSDDSGEPGYTGGGAPLGSASEIPMNPSEQDQGQGDSGSSSSSALTGGGDTPAPTDTQYGQGDHSPEAVQQATVIAPDDTGNETETPVDTGQEPEYSAADETTGTSVDSDDWDFLG